MRLNSGEAIPAQLVVLGVGVRPENKLAVDAGLEVAPRGGIRVNDYLQTSDPDIYAVGDAIEVKDFVTGEPAQVPLAGPANRQGRIAADNVFGRAVRFRGTQGTAIVGLFGLDGRDDRRVGEDTPAHEKTVSQALCAPRQSRGLLSGAEQMTLKVLFDPQSGRVLGAQGVGEPASINGSTCWLSPFRRA